MRLEGSLETSRLWRRVRRNVCAWFDNAPAWATGWQLVIRPKTNLDDDMLLEDGETDDPSRCWALFIDGDSLRVTLAVPTDVEAGTAHAPETAGFLTELLKQVADPSPY